MLAKAKRTEREEGGVGREDQAAMSFTSVTRVLPLKTVLNCSAIAYSFCKRGINGSGYKANRQGGYSNTMNLMGLLVKKPEIYVRV